MSQNNIAVGLDVGTTKVKVLIGLIHNDRNIQYIGYGECYSLGLLKGSIVDINNSVKSIEQAIHIAQKMAGVKVESVFISTTVEPQKNDQNEKIINLLKSVNRLGISVNDLVFRPKATAEAVLLRTEKEKGAIVIDIGGGTTDIAVVSGNELVWADVLPVGGNHITADLTFGLRILQSQAEDFKIEHACVLPELASEFDFVEVGAGLEKRKVSLNFVSGIIQPRVEEILTLAQRAIYNNVQPNNKSIVVLTGGTSQLPGIQQLADKIFDLPVKLAYDQDADQGLLNNPANSTVIGLVNYGLRGIEPVPTNDFYYPEQGLLAKVKNWLREYI